MLSRPPQVTISSNLVKSVSMGKDRFPMAAIQQAAGFSEEGYFQAARTFLGARIGSQPSWHGSSLRRLQSIHQCWAEYFCALHWAACSFQLLLLPLACGYYCYWLIGLLAGNIWLLAFQFGAGICFRARGKRLGVGVVLPLRGFC